MLAGQLRGLRCLLGMLSPSAVSGGQAVRQFHLPSPGVFVSHRSPTADDLVGRSLLRYGSRYSQSHPCVFFLSMTLPS